MDALELLANDHRKVETIFQQFEQGINLTQANQLFKELYQELSLHALAEENVFYPALARDTDLSSELKDAFKEHSEVKAVFGELAALEMSGNEWLDKMAKLIRDVKHHVNDEETKIFPRARQLFSATELQTLGQELQKAKDMSRESVMNSLPMQEINQYMTNMNSNTSFEGNQPSTY